MERDFDIHKWQAKFLKENAEESQSTLADYFSNREGSVKRASGVVDQLMSRAGLDPNLQNELVDAIIDLVDEIESNSNDSYDY